MIHSSESVGKETLIPSNGGKTDMNVRQQWRQLGEDVGQIETVEKDNY